MTHTRSASDPKRNHADDAVHASDGPGGHLRSAFPAELAMSAEFYERTLPDAHRHPTSPARIVADLIRMSRLDPGGVDAHLYPPVTLSKMLPILHSLVSRWSTSSPTA